MRTYYKALYRDKKGILSSMGRAIGHPFHLVVSYKEGGGETVAPEGTKLFIFNTHSQAQHFMQLLGLQSPPIELWEVAAEGVVDSCLVCGSLNPSWAVYEYWHRTLNGLPVGNLGTPAPIGTLTCDSLILKREVTRKGK